MTEQQDAPLLSTEPDTEGHLRSFGGVTSEDEDTEGHRAVYTAVPQDEKDDVEGHTFKAGNAVQPGFDEDGSSEH